MAITLLLLGAILAIPTAAQVGSHVLHPYDTDPADCVMGDDELLVLVTDWGMGTTDDTTLLQGVEAWALAPAPYC
ncbi:MAG: hypothetical protein R3185_07640 [Candidatus Thermoplasmatota archaeon]|nr:hypothetical protein [Candidatus Thermoplasmatota archaeon]